MTDLERLAELKMSTHSTENEQIKNERRRVLSNKGQNIIDKIVKKDFNNELEQVLASKSYEEDVKNLLLDILYRIDNAYNDYKS